MRICRFGNSYGMVCGDTVIDITTHVNNSENPGDGDALIRALPGLRGRDSRLLADGFMQSSRVRFCFFRTYPRQLRLVP